MLDAAEPSVQVRLQFLEGPLSVLMMACLLKTNQSSSYLGPLGNALQLLIGVVVPC